jgi:hypothetical protein
MIVALQTRDLARRLLAYEAVAGRTSVPTQPAALRIFEKLRRSFCPVAGVAGYRSLLSRALALARAEAPSLSAVQVTVDGCLQDLGECEAQNDKDQPEEPEVLLIAELLGLFLALLGAALTLRLVQDAAPQLEVTTKSGTPIPLRTILQEVAQLNNVSERLESLADQYPSVEDGLMTISGNIRNTAAVLEVLVLVKNKPEELLHKFETPASIN